VIEQPAVGPIQRPSIAPSMIGLRGEAQPRKARF